MRNKYPRAKLITDFTTGASDQLNSMIAAILLYDTNLAAGIREFGTGILDDSNFIEEMLAANYNGGTVRPHKSLRASILQSLGDWITDYLRPQTKEYIAKLRYIRDNYPY